MTKSVQADWQGELRFELASGSGGVSAADGKPGAEAFKPTELVLAALASCSAMDVISILSKKRQPVETYRVRVTAETRSEHPRVFTEITVEHVLGGNGIDPQAVSRSIELSALQYCPVTAIVSAGEARVRHRYSVNPGDGEQRDVVVITGPRGAVERPDA